MNSCMLPVVTRFNDRQHGGRLLAAALSDYAGRTDVVVLGLCPGGIPVAAEVAKALESPLDVIVARDLTLDGPEGIHLGGLSCGGVRITDDDFVRRARIDQRRIEAAAARELTALHELEMAYRGRTGPPQVKGRTVILVADGILHGAPILAAILALRAEEPSAIVVGTPVASFEAVQMLQPEIEDIAVLMTVANPGALEQWYCEEAIEDGGAPIPATPGKQPVGVLCAAGETA